MLQKEFLDLCDDLKQACDRHAGVDMTDPDNVRALEQTMMTVVGDYKSHGIIDHFEIEFFPNRNDPNALPMHIEFNVWMMPNNDNENGVLQLSYTSSYVYALLVNSASRQMMSPSDGGGGKSDPNPAPVDPDDAWDRAMKGM